MLVQFYIDSYTHYSKVILLEYKMHPTSVSSQDRNLNNNARSVAFDKRRLEFWSYAPIYAYIDAHKIYIFHLRITYMYCHFFYPILTSLCKLRKQHNATCYKSIKCRKYRHILPSTEPRVVSTTGTQLSDVMEM